MQEFAASASCLGHPLPSNITRVRFASWLVGNPSLGLNKCILASNSHSFSGMGGDSEAKGKLSHVA